MLIRRSPHEAWREPAISAWHNEDTLQQVLESAPELLPGFVGTRLVAAREVSTRYGPADLFVLDEEGNIAIVEVQLERNPRDQAQGDRPAARVRLVGLARHLRGLRDEVQQGRRPAPRRFRREIATDGEGGGGWDPDRFRATVEQNLAAGRFHLGPTAACRSRSWSRPREARTS